MGNARAHTTPLRAAINRNESLSNSVDSMDSDPESGDESFADENNESNTTHIASATKKKKRKKASSPLRRKNPYAEDKNALFAAVNDGKGSISTAAADLIERHSADGNSAQCELLNLVFRSVGGSPGSEIDPKALNLDDVTDDAWVALVTDVVADMQEGGTPPMQAGKPTSTGRRYASSFKKFFYAASDAALTQGPMARDRRLDVSLVRDLITRVTEVVGVGQPDIRYAGSVAIFEMSRAIAHKVKEFNVKIATAEKQAKSASGARLTALQKQVKEMNEACEEMGEVLTGPVFSVIFLHRYRDSCPAIRVCCLEYLAVHMIVLPDVFLNDRYLKYHGWMISDTDRTVRAAALAGLNLPFEAASSGSGAVDVSTLTNVTMKFLPKIAERCVDVSKEVQPAAMRLMLSLLKEGFLDDYDDDGLWELVNNRTLDPTSPKETRKLALQFLIEQLEEFDDDDDDEDAAAADSERSAVAKIDALASWIAGALTGGEDGGAATRANAQVRLTDFVVEGLRSIPEASGLATDWSAMLRAIDEDSAAAAKGGKTADRTTDEVKQLVLIRFLMAAVRQEVGHAGSKRTGKKSSHESLSIDLLKALPNLFVKFATNGAILGQLASLPRYLSHSVFSLPQRKNDFVSLCKALATAFTKTSDVSVMHAIAMSLTHMSSGSHSRKSDAQKHMSKLANDVAGKVTDLCDLRVTAAKKKGKNDVDQDSEYSLGLALTQMAAFAKRVDLVGVMGSDDVDAVVDSIQGAVEARVENSTKDNQFLSDSSKVVQGGLNVLLGVLAWKVNSVHKTEDSKARPVADDDDIMKDGDSDEDDDVQEDAVAVRNKLLDMCGLCLDLKGEGEDDGMPLETETDFAKFRDAVQFSAVQTASDLRSLCAKGLSNASNATLRELAMKDDAALIKGMTKFLKRQGKSVEARKLVAVARDLVANWDVVNRREAGMVLAEITGKGEGSSKMVLAVSKIAKGKDGVKLLESHMASLRQRYEDWQAAVPEEPVGGSDAQMEEYADAEEAHERTFKALTDQANRLSNSLGVGKLSNAKMNPAMVGFVKEGMRYAFSCPKKSGGGEDAEMYGDRLSFLGPLRSYLGWVKKNDSHRVEILREYAIKEKEFREHPFFEAEIHGEVIEVFGSSFEGALGGPLQAKRKAEDQSVDGTSKTSKSSASGSNLGSVEEEGEGYEVGVFEGVEGNKRRKSGEHQE